MPEARKLQPSFAAGELSPNLYARVDLDKYKAGAATMRNWYVDVRGGASTRPGTLFCGYSGTQVQPGDLVSALGNAPFAKSCILRPFLVGQGLDDSYVVEFGQFDLTSMEGYARFWQGGKPFMDPTVSLAITGATVANPCVVAATNTFAGGEWINIAGVEGMPELNGWWRVVAPTGSHFEIAPIPFLASPAQSSLTWGAWTSGGTVASILTLTTPYLLGDLLNLKYAQSADVMVLTHPSYYPATITLKAGTFSYSEIEISPTQLPPTDLDVFDGGTTDPDYCWSYCVTSTSLDGKSESVQSNIFFKHYTIPDDVTGWAESLKWTPPTTPSLFYTIYKCGPFDDRDATGPGTIWGKIGQSQSPTFHDNNIPPDFNIAPPIFGDPFSGGQLESITVTAGGSGWPNFQAWDGYIPLIFTGDGTGAAGFATTDHSGVITGAFLINSGKNYTHVTVTAPGPGSGATFSTTISSATPTFPACAAFYQQRLLLGGANSQPDTLALSVPGDYFNYNTTPISQPNDAFPVDIAGTEVDTIQSLMPVSYGCLVFTTGGVYLCNGGGTSQDITPSTIAFVAQAADGANALQPIRINYSVLYNQFRGCVVREMAFAWQRQSYTGDDISAPSNHLFFGFNIQNWTWSEALWRNVLMVRDDGVIVCLTYQPEQEVRGFARWDTQGSYLSIVSIPEQDFDINYSATRRHVQLSATDPCWTTYIERFDDRNWDCCMLEAWCLDCAIAAPVVSPDYPLFITEFDAETGAIGFQLFDPCEENVPGGTGPFENSVAAYVMEAVDNYSPTVAAALFANSAPNVTTTDQYWFATAFDPINRVINYLAGAFALNTGAFTWHNDTGHVLFDISSTYAIGADTSANALMPVFVAQLNIDTLETTFFDTHSFTNFVPTGVGSTFLTMANTGSGYSHATVDITGGTGWDAVCIIDAGGSGRVVDVHITRWGTGTPTFAIAGDGSSAVVDADAFKTPSDGTWIRQVRDVFVVDQNEVANSFNGPNLTDPRTGDFWVLGESCELEHLQKSDNYAKTICQAVYADADDLAFSSSLPPFGMDDDWVYCLPWLQDGGIISNNELVLVPRVRQAVEIQADAKLPYVIWATNPAQDDRAALVTFSTDGDAYLFSWYPSSSHYKFRLCKFVPPSVGTYGSNATGTYTDVTPWGASTGPNADGLAAAYSTYTPATPEIYIMFKRLPAGNQGIALEHLPFTITDIASATHLTMTLSATYIQFGGSITEDHHSYFIGPMLASDYSSTSTAASAAYNVVGVWEINPNYNRHNWVYSENDYTKQWFKVAAQVAPGGVPSATEGKIIFQQWQLAYGSPPVLLQSIPEDGWDAAYAAYGGAIGDALVVAGSINGYPATTAYNNNVGTGSMPCPGMYDPTTNWFWFNGLRSRGSQPETGSLDGGIFSNVIHLNSALSYRAAYNTVSPPASTHSGVTPPFVRLSNGPITPSSSTGVLQLGCALVNDIVSGNNGFSGTGTLSGTLPGPIPGDPLGTFDALPPGEWSFNPSITAITAAHLPNKSVWAMVDGMPVGPIQSDANGLVELGRSGSRVIVGLNYTCDLQTLRIEMEGLPTLQGRRKLLPAVDVIVECSLGLEVGFGKFEGMYPMPDTALPMTVPPPVLRSGVFHAPTGAYWDVEGQICFRQPWPLPATILGVVVEAAIGDDGE